MSNNAGGAQPPTPDDTGGDKPSNQPDHDDLDEFVANNPEALDAILYGEPDPGGDPPPPDEPDEEEDEAPEPEPEEDPEPEPEAEPSSEEEPEETDNPSLDPPGAPPQRIRLNRLQDDQKRAVASIVEELGKGRALEDILAERAPKPPAPADDDGEDGEQPPAARRDAPTPDPDLADVQARIKQAEADYEAAIEEYDTPKQARLLRELQRLEHQEFELKQQSRETAIAQQSAGQKFEANVKTLRSDYPYLNDENSPMSRRLGELRKMALFDDPNAETDPDFILGLAKQAAEDVGGAKAKGKPTSAPPQPKRTARPVGEVAGGKAPVGAAVKTATAVQDFEKMMAGMTDAEKAEWFDKNLPMPD